MKPKIFIGSSTEALDIAYAIQENLQHDSNPTVWTQGIFQLSSNALDDLFNALQNFDFGIFVFKPDDITIMRTDKLNTIRDNVIFELGLFIGKLGKDKVFFVLPSEVNDFHLPTDLLGVNPGKFNNNREDGNLKAALGPFCNQVRAALKKFEYINLVELDEESHEAKKIAIEKPKYWQIFLSAELFKSRLVKINQGYYELENNLVYQKSKKYNSFEYNTWAQLIFNDILKLGQVLKQLIEIELLKSLAEPVDISKVKYVADKMLSICEEFLKWEYEIKSVIPPSEANELHSLITGWSKTFIDEINKYPDLIKTSLAPENIPANREVTIKLTIGTHPKMDEIEQALKRYVHYYQKNSD